MDASSGNPTDVLAEADTRARAAEAHVEKLRSTSDSLQRRLAVLIDVGSAKAALVETVGALADVVGASHSSLALYFPGQSAFRPCFELEHSIESVKCDEPNIHKSPLNTWTADLPREWCRSSGQTFWCSREGISVVSDGAVPQGGPHMPGSLLVVVKGRGEIAGVVELSFSGPDSPALEQSVLYRAVAEHIAFLLESSPHIVGSAGLDGTHEKRVATLIQVNQALKRTAGRLMQADDPTEILPAILSECRDTLGACAGTLFEYAADQDALSLLCMIENDGRVVRTSPNRPSNGPSTPIHLSTDALWRFLAKSNQPLYSRTHDEPWHSTRGHTCSFRHALTAGGTPYGALSIAFLQDRSFSRAEIELFSALAHFATIALQLASLARAANTRAIHVAVLRERTRASRVLHDSLMQTLQMARHFVGRCLDNDWDENRQRTALDTLSLWMGRAADEGRVALEELRADAASRGRSDDARSDSAVSEV